MHADGVSAVCMHWLLDQSALRSSASEKRRHSQIDCFADGAIWERHVGRLFAGDRQRGLKRHNCGKNCFLLTGNGNAHVARSAYFFDLLDDIETLNEDPEKHYSFSALQLDLDHVGGPPAEDRADLDASHLRQRIQLDALIERCAGHCVEIGAESFAARRGALDCALVLACRFGGRRSEGPCSRSDKLSVRSNIAPRLRKSPCVGRWRSRPVWCPWPGSNQRSLRRRLRFGAAAAPPAVRCSEPSVTQRSPTVWRLLLKPRGLDLCDAKPFDDSRYISN
jgi:hypothetical protein